MVFAYWRETEGDRALVLLNFSAETREVALPDGAWYVGLSTALHREERAEKRLELRPFEGVILQPHGAS